MPLNTQIRRNGRTLDLRWGGFHVAAMVMAAAWDSGQGPWEKNVPPTQMLVRDTPDGEWRPEPLDYPSEACPVTPDDTWWLMDYPAVSSTPMWGHDGYTLRGEHRFIDVTDGEILHLLPGDVLVAWRDR